MKRPALIHHLHLWRIEHDRHPGRSSLWRAPDSQLAAAASRIDDDLALFRVIPPRDAALVVRAGEVTAAVLREELAYRRLGLSRAGR